jgi:predicted nucleic acid-binding protein
MATLIDTSFLLAAFYTRDQNHNRASSSVQQALESTPCIVPAPVLQELFYMATARMGYRRAIETCELVMDAGFEIEALLNEDIRRLLNISRQYTSASFDYTDAAIMALSERLNITQVYTFDRRDFSIFRPRHCEYLELLPA